MLVNLRLVMSLLFPEVESAGASESLYGLMKDLRESLGHGTTLLVDYILARNETRRVMETLLYKPTFFYRYVKNGPEGSLEATSQSVHVQNDSSNRLDAIEATFMTLAFHIWDSFQDLPGCAVGSSMKMRDIA